MKLHSIIKMDTIFMNSENSKTSEPHILILKLSDKLVQEEGKGLLLYQILVFITRGKHKKLMQ